MVESRTKQINVRDFKVQGSNKTAVYNFLVHENQVFLPDKECITTWFMKQIINGTKGMSYSFE